ncbi:MAG: response regulator transcription factor [Eubacteriales bacterium]|jgi:two-component system OmpR family response regulator
MYRILVVEDDNELRNLFMRVLSKNGYKAFGATDGDEAMNIIKGDYIDLVISDIMMPNMDGYELIKKLRDMGSSIPVLIITAKDGFKDMQQGFMTGADDYMVKPVNVNEMVLRVGALLRRAQILSERMQTIGGFTLEYDSMTVVSGNSREILPQKEFLLLYKLVSCPNRIFTRRQLMDDIWGVDSETEERTVDVHINRLRDKFRDNPDFEIVTVRGLGYKAVRK